MKSYIGFNHQPSKDDIKKYQNKHLHAYMSELPQKHG